MTIYLSNLYLAKQQAIYLSIDKEVVVQTLTTVKADKKEW